MGVVIGMVMGVALIGMVMEEEEKIEGVALIGMVMGVVMDVRARKYF